MGVANNVSRSLQIMSRQQGWDPCRVPERPAQPGAPSRPEMDLDTVHGFNLTTYGHGVPEAGTDGQISPAVTGDFDQGPDSRALLPGPSGRAPEPNGQTIFTPFQEGYPKLATHEDNPFPSMPGAAGSKR